MHFDALVLIPGKAPGSAHNHTFANTTDVLVGRIERDRDATVCNQNFSAALKGTQMLILEVGILGLEEFRQAFQALV